MSALTPAPGMYGAKTCRDEQRAIPVRIVSSVRNRSAIVGRNPHPVWPVCNQLAQIIIARGLRAPTLLLEGVSHQVGGPAANRVVKPGDQEGPISSDADLATFSIGCTSM